MSNRRVVVTGTGIWSCLGTSLEAVKKSLYEGHSGIGIAPERIEIGYQSALTGIVERPVLKGILDRRLRVGLSEEAEYAYMASREAFANAGISEEYMLENEIGVLFGNDSSAKAVVESEKIMEEKKDSSLLGSGWIFQVNGTTAQTGTVNFVTA